MSSKILVDEIAPKTSGGVITSGAMASPGGVIECITGPCNGSSITVSSGTYTMPNVTGTQALTTSYADITGSSIDYTAPAGTKRVSYDLYLTFSSIGLSGISHYKFFVDGTEATDARRTMSYSYDTNTQGNMATSLRWVIEVGGTADSDTPVLADWTSAKTLKWQGRNYDSSYKMEMHRNHWWDGASATGTNLWAAPVLTITAYG